jgi:hypothetical protein
MVIKKFVHSSGNRKSFLMTTFALFRISTNFLNRQQNILESLQLIFTLYNSCLYRLVGRENGMGQLDCPIITASSPPPPTPLKVKTRYRTMGKHMGPPLMPHTINLGNCERKRRQKYIITTLFDRSTDTHRQLYGRLFASIALKCSVFTDVHES